MFRNPRENASPSITTPIRPSTGRPPTPPGDITVRRSTRNSSATIMTMTTLHANATNPKSNTMTPIGKATRDMAAPTSGSASTPVLGRIPQKKLSMTPGKRTSSSGGGGGGAMAKGKPNQSILSFFKKVEGPVLGAEMLFLGVEDAPQQTKQSGHTWADGDVDEELYGDGVAPVVETALSTERPVEAAGPAEVRFNENSGPIKRRKTQEGTQDHLGMTTVNGAIAITTGAVPTSVQEQASNGTKGSTFAPAAETHRTKGPFLDDSDDDEEVLATVPAHRSAYANEPLHEASASSSDVKESSEDAASLVSSRDGASPCTDIVSRKSNDAGDVALRAHEARSPGIYAKPSSPAQTSSTITQAVPPKGPSPSHASAISSFPVIPHFKQEATSQWLDFDDVQDFPDEFADDGEEFLERKWMEEQAVLEAAEQGDPNIIKPEEHEEITAACPICNISLDGIKAEDATKHVNGCLDGKPTPLSKPPLRKESSETRSTLTDETSEVRLMPDNASKRFARRAAQPRPGQPNPVDMIHVDGNGPSSAFSKLMSGHAEDAAWATAAAAEHAARGKPAYQRTCPFYKIMPGFFICVDAFRYGAVQGCNAYFLSHFHSDHYVGLTSMWCHGPIYCSKVTANLVKQQLRVDPQYVVALEFDEKIDVPGTQGVSVTMIPANHCPGSSLYLFEKVIGRGKIPKVQRVLHCGDFRACPAHIAHPQLMPNIIDQVSGKTKHQKIDVCYLDTTYLNPRYAFPSQEEVITACADMCISLRKERAEDSDAWETSKRERATNSMAKFVAAASPVKSELDDADNQSKTRGRLLIICGTYSIGKERICMGIARALDCKIYAPPGKMRICAALEDPELMSRMTPHPLEAQIHMQMLMEIRPETLGSYLDSYRPHFSRIVAFRPSGWNYKPPVSRGLDTASVENILQGRNWKSHFGLADLVPQRGSTREVMCFGVPYSEHSSFRELTMFVCALRIDKVVPTVNVGSAKSRATMRTWVERWMAERRKADGGVVRIGNGEGEVKW